MYDKAVFCAYSLGIKIEKDEICQIYEYFIEQAKEYARQGNEFEAERLYDKAVSYANMLGIKIKKSKFNKIFNLEDKKEYTEAKSSKKLTVNVNFMQEYEYFIRQAKEYEKQGNNVEAEKMYDRAASYVKSLGIEIKQDEISQIYEYFIRQAKECARQGNNTEVKKMYYKAVSYAKSLGIERKKDEISQIYECFIDKAKEIENEAKKCMIKLNNVYRI